MRKLRKLSAIHKELWKLMSEYVRKRDESNGCITCDKRLNWAEMQAGHFVHVNSLDYNLKNINSQCAGCNCYKHGDLGQYAINIDKKWGAGTAEELLSLKHKIHKFTREELECIKSALKIKISEL